MEQKTEKKPSFSLTYYFRTRKYLAIAIAFAMVSVALFFVSVFPRIQSLRANQQKLSKEQRKLEQLESKQAILSSVESTDVYTQRQRIHAILPSQKPVLQLLQQVKQLSGQTNVVLSEYGVTPGEISTESATPARRASDEGLPATIDQIEVKMTVVGPIEAINQFLKGVSTMAPVTQTSALSLEIVQRQDLLSLESQTDVAELYEASMTLTSYFYIARPQAKVDQQLPEAKSISEQLITQLQSFVLPTTNQPTQPVGVIGGGKTDLFE